MAGIDAKCTKTFKRFVELSSVGKTLTEADKKEIRDKGMHKMLKECCTDTVAKASEAQVFPKYCDKKTKKLKLEVFLGDFIKELAAAVLQNERKLAKRPALNDPDVEKLANEIKEQIGAKSEFKMKDPKVDAVTARLMDSKGFTGTHKERFDEAGKGKGVSGRKDIVDNSGYVSGFKGHKAEDGACANP